MEDKDGWKVKNIMKNKDIINNNIEEIILLYEESIKKKSSGLLKLDSAEKTDFCKKIKDFIDGEFKTNLEKKYDNIKKSDIETIKKEYYEGKTEMPIKKGE